MEKRPFQPIPPPLISPIEDVQRKAFEAFSARIWIQDGAGTRPARPLTPLEWAGLWDAIRAHGLKAHRLDAAETGVHMAIVHRPDEPPHLDPIIILDLRHAPDEDAWRAELDPIPGRASGVVVRLDEDTAPASGTFG